MNIPEQAAEAVLRRGHQTWPDGYDESQQAVIRAAARKDLEAAAPFIAAQALRDALNEVDTMRSGPAAAPYVSATKALLRSIADQWDEQ